MMNRTMTFTMMSCALPLLFSPDVGASIISFSGDVEILSGHFAGVYEFYDDNHYYLPFRMKVRVYTHLLPFPSFEVGVSGVLKLVYGSKGFYLELQYPEVFNNNSVIIDYLSKGANIVLSMFRKPIASSIRQHFYRTSEID